MVQLIGLRILTIRIYLKEYVLYHSEKEDKKSSSQVYLRDGAILAQQNTAGNSIKFKYSALTLKYLEGFIEEPTGWRQISVVWWNVHFIKILCKVFKDGLEWVRILIHNLQVSDVSQRFSAKILENSRAS